MNYLNLNKSLITIVGCLAIVLFHCSPSSVSAQTVDVGPPDTSVCNGTPITLTAITTGVVGTPTFTDFSFNVDDQHGPVVDIGFPFDYFGNTYTQCVVSTNGYITFDLATANTGSPWSINNASPTPGVPDNSIMFPWQDINPGSGSGGTKSADCGDGTFIVDFVDIAMFSCTSLNFSMQVKLYQGSNIIETYIANKPLCTTWNGGAAIHGLENATGTQSVIVPGRNFPTQWSTTNDAVRFTPDGFGSYTIDQTIPFNPTPVGNETIEWTDGQGNVLGSTNSITVTPIAPTWYYCTYRSACSAITVSDSILVTLGNVNISTQPTDASCFGFADGFVKVDPVGSAYPVSLALSDPSGTQLQLVNGVYGIDTLFGLVAGDYTATVTDGVGCQTSLDFTIDEPTLLVPNAGHFDILCNGYDDGKAYSYPFGGIGPYETVWNDPLAQTTDTAYWLAPGAYTLTVTDAQNCVSDTTLSISEPLPLIITMSSGADTCLYTNGAVRAVVQGGTVPYIYTWNNLGGDSANFDMDSVNYAWSLLSNLSQGEYGVLVTDANGCFIESSISVPVIPPPYADFLSRSKPLEFVDPEVQFDNESSAALTYEWHFGDSQISYEENPLHSYDTAGVFLVMMIAYNDPQYGCADTTFKYIEVEPMFTFYIPSGFTPDDDGLNDTWGPSGQNFQYASYNVKIFDRWGKLIWQTDNPDKFWDGTYQSSLKPVKQGMYVYVFDLKKSSTFEPKTITGTVSLYRHK
ncbi:MAG: gliding motility-associated C-terminal domain-containing protein [Flavobacteriales bacterium]|nr:gliding motility-associated C-terminal domain-containing protein [Flavobacteriales bacterium]